MFYWLHCYYKASVFAVLKSSCQLLQILIGHLNLLHFINFLFRHQRQTEDSLLCSVAGFSVGANETVISQYHACWHITYAKMFLKLTTCHDICAESGPAPS